MAKERMRSVGRCVCMCACGGGGGELLATPHAIGST